MPRTGPAGSNTGSILRLHARRREDADLTLSRGGCATGRRARARRYRPGRAASSSGAPATPRRSTGATSAESILRGPVAFAPAGAACRPATGALQRLLERTARVRGVATPGRAQDVALDVLDELAHQLRGDIGEHSATELRDLARDREIGGDVDLGAAALGRHRDDDRRLRVSLSTRVAARRVDDDPAVGLVDLGEARRYPCTGR